MKGINKTLLSNLQDMLLQDWGADLSWLVSTMEELHNELDEAEGDVLNHLACFDAVGNFYHEDLPHKSTKFVFDCNEGKLVYDCENNAIDFEISDDDIDGNIKTFCSELSNGIKTFTNDLNKTIEIYNLIK